MRTDPDRLRFEIEARDGAARTGTIHTAHGPVATPAFIPLATRGSVRTLSFDDVAEIGYELVLGNTFHLFLAPGAERIAELGGLHEFIGWERAIITDSGGFQVFSLAHGNVADEIKGRRGGSGSGGGVLEISERGVRFRSYVDGSRAVHGPGGVDVGPGGAGLGHRARLRRVHALPRRPRLHGAVDRAHPPVARPLPRVARSERPAGPGRVRDRPGRRPRGPAARVGRSGAARRASTGWRSAARSVATRRRCTGCWR